MISDEDKKLVEQLQKYIDFNTKRVKRLARIGKMMEDSPDGWAALKEDIEATANGAEQTNTNLVNSPFLPEKFDPIREKMESFGRASAAMAYRSVIANVEKASDKIATLNREIATAKDGISKITERTQETSKTRRREIA